MIAVKSLRTIVIGLGSAGDVHPNVGLALALRERGHDVLFVAPARIHGSFPDDLLQKRAHPDLSFVHE